MDFNFIFNYIVFILLYIYIIFAAFVDHKVYFLIYKLKKEVQELAKKKRILSVFIIQSDDITESFFYYLSFFFKNFFEFVKILCNEPYLLIYYIDVYVMQNIFIIIFVLISIIITIYIYKDYKDFIHHKRVNEIFSFMQRNNYSQGKQNRVFTKLFDSVSKGELVIRNSQNVVEYMDGPSLPNPNDGIIRRMVNNIRNVSSDVIDYVSEHKTIIFIFGATFMVIVGIKLFLFYNTTTQETTEIFQKMQNLIKDPRYINIFENYIPRSYDIDILTGSLNDLNQNMLLGENLHYHEFFLQTNTHDFFFF